MIEVILPYLFLASGLVLRKMILFHAQPVFAAGMRLVLAGVLLLGYLLVMRRPMRIVWRDLFLFMQGALFFVYLSYVLAELTLEDLSSARFAFMFNLMPFITAIISYFYLGETLNKKQLGCLCLGFIGFMPLLLVGEKAGVQSASLFSWPGLQLFISTVAYAYGWIIVSRLVNKGKYSPFLVTGFSFFIGGIATLFTSYFWEQWYFTPPVTNVIKFTSYLIGIVFISEIIASNIYATLLKRYSATFLAFAGIMYPLFSAFFAWIFLKESITVNFFISVAIVSVALYLFHRSTDKISVGLR
jgi:drug/metabolite transporter (DMT)-like permease